MWLCQAGFFHSVYGTEVFRHVTVSLELRAQVRAIIGEQAEQLAYWFGAMTRSSFLANEQSMGRHTLQDRFTQEVVSVNETQWRALCKLVVANALEQFLRIDPERRRSFPDRYGLILDSLSSAAAIQFGKLSDPCFSRRSIHQLSRIHPSQ